MCVGFYLTFKSINYLMFTHVTLKYMPELPLPIPPKKTYLKPFSGWYFINVASVLLGIRYKKYFEEEARKRTKIKLI